MNELDTLRRAQQYMEQLAQGIDPISGQELPEDTVLNQARLVRCFFYVAGILKEDADRLERGERARQPKKPEFYLTEAERAAVPISETPVTVSVFVQTVNDAVGGGESRKKLTLSAITNWLVEKGFLREVETAPGKRRKCVTPLAATVEALWTGAQSVCQGSTVTVQAEGLTLSANAGNCYLELNGRCLYVEEGFKIDALGDVMVPTRLIADALGASVAWSGDVVLTRNALPVLESGDTFYDAYTLDLISRVIMHESGNQCLEGKIAVGNVILNRVASPLFPNTVYDVLFQKNQFPGATNATPTSECIIAAKLALEGVNVVPNAYWFNRVGLNSWAAKNKTLLTIIEDHAFYG